MLAASADYYSQNCSYASTCFNSADAAAFEAGTVSSAWWAVVRVSSRTASCQLVVNPVFWKTLRYNEASVAL